MTDYETILIEKNDGWLKARLLQMTHEQKNSNWSEHGIGKFIEGVYASGKGAAPKAAE